jgi:8-oxo-dGTP diphosphatase
LTLPPVAAGQSENTIPSEALPATPSRRRNRQATPNIAVLVVIFTVEDNRLKVLLIRRSAAPFKDAWALPGGRLNECESLQAAAVRKLVEETGVEDLFLEQLYTFDGLDKEAPGGAVAIIYFALVDHARARLSTRTEWQPAWHPVAELPDVAFDNKSVINYALNRLRAKLEYTNVVYSLLPEYFTLSRLQSVYESILMRQLDKRNFRKRMLSLDIIHPTGKKKIEGAHRPAELYTFASREPTLI